jgi:hypothetical protein
LYRSKRSHVSSVSIGKILLVLLAIVLAGSTVYSFFPNSGIMIRISGSITPPSSLTMIGVNHGVQGGGETSSFVQSLASAGLRWDRDYLGLSNLNWEEQAGINLLALSPGGDPETSCGSGVLQSESSYKSGVISDVNSFQSSYGASIHDWEYGNEVQNYWCNISPQNYFQGLVWMVEAIHSMPGHASDNIYGGGSITIWTIPQNGVWDGYGSCSTVSSCQPYSSTCPTSGVCGKPDWFYTLWQQRITDSFGSWTMANAINYVAIHLYLSLSACTSTSGPILFGSVLNCGPYSGKTVQTMLTDALNLYYGLAGNSKQFVVTETGYPSDTSGGTAAQNSWYKEMMPFYQSLGYIHGVFAYDLYDGQTTLWGLFDSSFSAKPAWSVFQSYFSGISSSSSSTTTSSSLSSTSNLSTASSFSATSSTSDSSVSPSSSTQTFSTSIVRSSLRTSFSPSAQAHSQPNVISAMLSSMSPSKDPPVAYGFATYEITLIIGSLGVLVMIRRKHNNHAPIEYSWRW